MSDFTEDWGTTIIVAVCCLIFLLFFSLGTKTIYEETGILQEATILGDDFYRISVNNNSLTTQLASGVHYSELVVGDKIYIKATERRHPITDMFWDYYYIVNEITILERTGI